MLAARFPQAGWPARSIMTRSVNVPNTAHVTVLGVAVHRVPADLAQIAVSIVSVKETMALAKADVDARSSALIVEARRRGIVDDDLVAAELKLAPNREWKNGEVHQRGFVAERSVTLKLRRLDTFNDLMTALVAIPVNRIVSVERQVQQADAARQAALGLAADDARRNADFLAARLGVKVGKVFGIDCVPRDAQPSYELAMATRGGAAADAGEPAFEPGLVDFSASVQVTFYLDEA